MTVGDLCTRTVRTISSHASLIDAAGRMRDHDVGTLVVVDGGAPLEGIVTDRDLVVRGLAAGIDPAAATVGEIMTRGPAAVEERFPVERALGIMADQRVRRLIVLDAEGGLVGILALDDIVRFLGAEVDDVARLVRRQTPV